MLSPPKADHPQETKGGTRQARKGEDGCSRDSRTAHGWTAASITAVMQGRRPRESPLQMLTRVSSLCHLLALNKGGR